MSVLAPTLQPTLRPVLQNPLGSGIGSSYPKNGRVLDLAAFTYTYSEVRDKSPEGNEAVLYSGRAVSLDGVDDTVSYPTDFDNEEITVKVLLRSATTGNKLLAGTFGELYFNVQSTGIWKEYTDTSTISGSLDWSPSADVEVSELRVYDSSGTLVHRYLHNEYVDETVDGLDGLLAFDTVGGTHGTYTGCTTVTQIGFDSALAGLGAYGDQLWFDGVDDRLTKNSSLPISNTSEGFDITIETISQWNSTHRFFAFNNSSNYRFELASGQMSVWLGGATANVTRAFFNIAGALNYGALQKFRFVYNGSSSVTLYIDDVLFGSSGVFAPVNVAVTSYQLGCAASGTYEGVIVSFAHSSITWDGTEADAIANGWTVNGSPNTVAELRTTPPQVLGMDFNQYRWFDGVEDSTNVLIPAIYTWSGDFELSIKFLLADPTGDRALFGYTATLDDLIYVSTSQLRIRIDGTFYNLTHDNTLDTFRVYSIVIRRVSGVLSYDLDGITQTATASGATGNYSVNLIGIADYPTAFSSSTFLGILFDVNLNNQLAYSGIGNDAWKDTIGSNDGTESGPFENVLVPESLTTGTDALGNAIESPRTNKTFNADGSGYSVVPDADSLDVTTEATWVFKGNFYGVPAVGQYIVGADTVTGDRKYDIANPAAGSADQLFIERFSGGVSSSFFLSNLQDIGVAIHVITFNNTTGEWKLYQDGALVDTVNRAGAIDSKPNRDYTLLASSDKSLISQTPISDVKIYNRALTAEEVAKFK